MAWSNQSQAGWLGSISTKRHEQKQHGSYTMVCKQAPKMKIRYWVVWFHIPGNASYYDEALNLDGSRWSGTGFRTSRSCVIRFHLLSAVRNKKWNTTLGYFDALWFTFRQSKNSLCLVNFIVFLRHLPPADWALNFGTLINKTSKIVCNWIMGNWEDTKLPNLPQ